MRKIIILSTILIFICFKFSAQIQREEVLASPNNLNKQIDKDEPLTFVDQNPEYIGGDDELVNFISKNVKYPKKAQKRNIQGTVYIQFIVGSNGKVREPKVLKDIGYGCGQEAVRIINKMPDWIPGRQANKPVAVYVKMPIKFQLK